LLIGAVSILFFLIRALLSNAEGSRKQKKGRPEKIPDVPGIDLQDVEANPEAYDLAALIEQAEKNGDFALALRLQFISTLRSLASRTWIQRQRGKSNRQYLLEMEDTPLYPALKKLTAQFEKVFYGGYGINESKYEQARIDFHEFQQRVELSDPSKYRHA
jgi:hypothetical protein